MGEAMAMYRGGQPWWLETPALDELPSRSRRTDKDTWAEPIADWLEHPKQRWEDNQSEVSVRLQEMRPT
jgi:hypothetical protein